MSGFLISYALNNKYPESASGTFAFYRSRFLRIYPLWWVLLLFCGAIGLRRWSGHALTELIPPALLIGSDWIVAFWTYPDPYWSAFPPETEIGWTLGAELTFYLVAPYLLRSNRAATMLFIGSAALRILVLGTIVPDAPAYKTWTYLFFPSLLVFFLLGHFAEKLHRSRPIGLAASAALLIAAAAMACRLDETTSLGSPWFHLAAVCFAMALPGIFAATKDGGFSNFLGNLTYPLYLFHSVLIYEIFTGSLSGIGQALIAVSNQIFDLILFKSIFVTGMVLAMALCVAAAVYYLIEFPLRIGFSWIIDVERRKFRTISSD